MSEAIEACSLAPLRERIDSLDAKIIELLNERARVVVKIGEAKRSNGGPIYAPHREAAVLGRVLQLNEGPLPDRCIERIYRELMSGSFALERPLRIGYLGPEGSHSHVAARLQFGASVEYEDLRSIEGVFVEVQRGHVDYGLVPIENSAGGGICETLDVCQQVRGEVFAYAEVQTQVCHHLLARCKPQDVTKIYSKPEVFAQCRHWVQTQYPQAELVASPSSSHAVRLAAQKSREGEAGLAAIGSILAAERYDLPVLFESIEDNPNNLTRFLVLAKERALPTGDDKTSIMFTTHGTAGALSEVLALFGEAGINLTHIDKRPSGRQNWTYTFFVDAQGHRDDEVLAQVIERASKVCQDLKVLGSYPRARRVL